MTTVEVRVARGGNNPPSVTLQTRKVLQELRAKGVPVVGAWAIQIVRHGVLSVFRDSETGEYVYRWVGDLDEDDGLI